MSTLSISLFGTFEVQLDGEPVSGFSSRKAQALLAYLAVEVRPHHREELAGLFWPYSSDAPARTNLRSALANIRHVIDDRLATPPHLLIDRQTIQFNGASDHHLDVSIFDGLPQTHLGDAELVPQLEAAVARVHGPFLAGFSLADCPDFEEWLLLKREYFNRQVGKALRILARYHSQQNDHVAALAHARRWVNLDPWQEEAHRQVMLQLALSGRRSEALAHFATCRRALRDELDVEPSDETLHLFEQIQKGEYGGAPRDHRLSVSRHHLPSPLTPLIGRDSELGDVARLLADADVRLLTIVGHGGIGKTHLALEAAVNQISDYRHGGVMVSLAPLQSETEIVSAIGEALRFSFYEHVPAEQQIIDYLREKEMLLVLDNFEHLLAGTPFVTKMLESAPKLKILATSRVKLHVQGEQLYPLAGLAYPNDGQMEALLAGNGYHRYGALLLFAAQARRLYPDFTLSQKVIGDVARICQLVDGMPLGIVLASAWIEMLTPGEIASEIERSFTFLRADGQGLPARQQNLESVFEHTWSLLTEREKSMFAQSSIFRGGFTQDAAQTVMGAKLPDLLALLNKFLLHRSANGRYTIHELLRQFAARKLFESSAAEMAARQRHCAYYCGFLSERADDLKGARQQAAFSETEDEEDNIRVAWRWAADHTIVEHLDEAMDCLGIYYDWRGRYHDGKAACQLATEKLQEIQTTAAIRVPAKILTWQAHFSRLLGQTKRARELANQSLNLLDGAALDNPDVRPAKAAALLELGQLAENVADARQLLEQALSIYRSLNDRWRTAQTLRALGASLGMKGAYAENPGILEESLQLNRSLGDQRGVAEVIGLQGFYGVLTGHNAQGVSLLRESCAVSQGLGDRPTMARSLALLGVGYDFSGEFADAFDAYHQALQINQDLGRRANVAGTQAMLSESCSHLGRYDEARSRAEIALRLGHEIQNPAVSSYALWFLSFADVAQGAALQAAELLTESITMHKEIGWPSREHDVLATLGFAYLKSHQFEQAKRCLIDVLKMARENSFFRTSVEGICLAACYVSTQEEPDRAVELYALAQRYPYIAKSCWFQDVAGPYIEAATDLLPPDEVQAARERGRARDRWQTIDEILESLSSN